MSLERFKRPSLLAKNEAGKNRETEVTPVREGEAATKGRKPKKSKKK